MSAAPSPSMAPGLRRNMVTICAMTATIMQALDTTIANVALPYMQGTLSASQDQINWVLTSYIVAAAIMTAPVGWIANRFGRKRIFIICSAGFTVASVFCGLAQDISQMVLFRLLQGVFGAALVPLSQAVMLDSYALHERAKAMSIWGMGVMMGPIMGPSLGAWLTETYSWHWVFFVNLPFGAITVLGLVVFMDETKKDLDLRFDWFGFTALAVAIGSLQLALDRGEQLGWLESNEIVAEFIISGIGFYYFFAHSLTTSKPFIQFALFKDRNFLGGCVFMTVMGLVLYSTMALSSPYLQNVIGYPIITAGILLASRGCGTFVAMMLVGRMMRFIEARTLIISGLALTALSLFQMTGWTDQTNAAEIVEVSIVQGFGFGLVFVPLSTVAFLTLPNHLRTDGTSMLTLLRNVASSIGISIVIAQLTEGSRRVYAKLSEHINPFNHALQMPDVAGMINLNTDTGRALADKMVAAAGADHRVLARLPIGDGRHPGLDPARDHDRLDQGDPARAVRRALGSCGGDGVASTPIRGRTGSRHDPVGISLARSRWLHRLARCRRAGITGVRRPGWLDQQQMHFFVRDGAMLNALWHHVHLPRPKDDCPISKLNIEHAFQDQEKVIRVIVLVPDKLAFQFRHHDIAVIELGDCPGRKVLGKRRQLL